MAGANNNWPRYCIDNNWLFFLLAGSLISATIINFCTFLTYALFEDLNWVLISCYLMIYAVLFTTCGAVYMWEEATGCEKCEVPILRMSKLVLAPTLQWVLSVDSNNPRLSKIEEYEMTKSFLSNTSVGIERSVAYMTFIVGILYTAMFCYYISRREKA